MWIKQLPVCFNATIQKTNIIGWQLTVLGYGFCQINPYQRYIHYNTLHVTYYYVTYM